MQNTSGCHNLQIYPRSSLRLPLWFCAINLLLPICQGHQQGSFGGLTNFWLKCIFLPTSVVQYYKNDKPPHVRAWGPREYFESVSSFHCSLFIRHLQFQSVLGVFVKNHRILWLLSRQGRKVVNVQESGDCSVFTVPMSKYTALLSPTAH